MTTNAKLLQRRSNPSVSADRDARVEREVMQEAGPEEVEQHSARKRAGSQAPTDERLRREQEATTPSTREANVLAGA